MPYLHCPRCRRTAWKRTDSAPEIACHHCGTTLNPMAGNETRFLTGAVRQRYVRDQRLGVGRRRFLRD